MSRCVLAFAGRCASLAAGQELPDVSAHPFLRGASWCGRCSARYLSRAVRVEDAACAAGVRELDHWPRDADGLGSLCSLCGISGRTLLCCDGPCEARAPLGASLSAALSAARPA